MEDINETFGMGWLPDLPDYRDYSPDHPTVKPLLKKIRLTEPATASLPASLDLRQWCSPIEDQDGLGSCTAHAGVGLIEYYERKAFGRHIDASRLFLYKTTRNLLGWTGDTGAFLRTTMGAMTLFGVPPEKYWPYWVIGSAPGRNWDDEPPAFCYAFAQGYQTLDYFRLDPVGISRADLLQRVKTYLAAQMPSMFGFSVFESYSQTKTNGGKFPFPCPGEKIVGGHAVVAIGYDDSMKIKNTTCGKETTGAFLIRNSWGTNWGQGGYGWLPYDYILQGMAEDWWAILKKEYIDTNQFGF